MHEEQENLPQGWAEAKFIDLVSKEPNSMKRGPFGSAIKKSFFVPSGFKVYEQQNAIKNDSSLGAYYIDQDKLGELVRFSVSPGDYLVSCSGTIGRITQLPDDCEPGVINQALLKITLNHDLMNSKYFLFLFRSHSFQTRILKDTRGSGMQNLASVKDIKNLDVLPPPLKEQLRIVAKIEELFSELDKGVENLKTAREQLKIYRQAVLKHAFEGKLTEQWRKENKDKLETAEQLCQKIINAKEDHERPVKKIKRLSREEISNLSILPAGWNWERLGNLTNLIAGKAFKKSEYSEEGMRLFQIANVGFGEIVWDKIAYLPDTYWNDLPDLRLQSNDLVMALNRPVLGDELKIGILSEDDVPSILYQRVGKFLLYDPSYCHWIFNYLRSSIFISALKQELRGVNIPFINQTRLLEYPVPVCALHERERILSEIEVQITQTDHILEQIDIELQKTEALRQSILKKAFSGLLVGQDPNDESASVLLERIKAEKAAQAPNKKNKQRRKVA